MINETPPPPLPSVIPKSACGFGSFRLGMAWHGAVRCRALPLDVCMRVYYRLHYDIFHSKLSLKISSVTHTHTCDTRHG